MTLKRSNFVTRIVTSLFVGCQLVLNTPTTARANDIHEQHNQLWQALEKSGVRIVLNHPEDCNGYRDGLYDSLRGYITICQDNATKAFEDAQWTANDLDTLRHEAQHVIQDCASGRLGDGNLVPMFPDKKERDEYIASILSTDEIKKILFDYKDVHYTVIQTELEAFAVAKIISASDIAKQVNNFCSES